MSEVKLPEGWVKTNLGSILELKYGKSLPEKIRDGEVYPVYGSNGIVGKHSHPLIKNCGLIVGRKGSYGEVNISQEPFFPIDTTYFIDTFHSQPIKYWFYQLKKLPLTILNRSTAIPGLNREDAYKQVIFLPAIQEQRVIAEKLNTLLTQVDSIKARLNKVPFILKQFRRAILSAVINKNSFSTSTVKKGKISDITSIISGIAFKKSQYSGNGNKLLQIANISHGETCWDNTSYIPFNLAEDYSRCSLEKNDIVLALNRPITNDSLKVALIHDTDLPATLYQRVARIRIPREFRDIISPNFLFMIMQSDEFRKEIEKNLQGSDQPYLNTSQLYNFEIQYPSKEEQAEIVRRVEQLFAYADGVEKQVQHALERVNNLTQSILAKAFRGELTAQWRAENPELISGENSAEALLARIKAERAAQQPQKKTRQKASTTS